MRKLIQFYLMAITLALIIAALVGVRYIDPSYRNSQQAIYAARASEAPARQRAITRLVEIAASALAIGSVIVIVGGSAFGVLLLLRRMTLIYPQRGTGLYPQTRSNGRWENLNEERSQTLAVYAAFAAHRPTAGAVRRILDPQPALPALPEPDQRPRLDAGLPRRVEIYQSPAPRHPPALQVGIGPHGPVDLPLRNLGNVLIGGLPGEGKTEGMASMIVGLLRQDASGRTIQIAIIDTKMIDFGQIPQDLAALRWPVAIDIDDATVLIRALSGEVQSRFERLHEAGARHLDQYNRQTGHQLPYLIAFLDEIADLTADLDRERRREFLGHAMEIGRKGRAAGVSLIMATQRPSTDVIPSSLRNIAGVQIAYRVSKLHDSQAILDEPGAELIPAGQPGRCLVRRGDIIPCQTYLAGLETRRFDQFIASLPRGQARTWPVPDTAKNPLYRPVPAENGADAAAIPAGPAFDPLARSDGYTPEQIAHIRQLYGELGSIKAVQRALYAQDGGYWFYRIREVVERDAGLADV